MEYDLATHLEPVQAIIPAAYAAADDGEIIDSVDFNSLTFAINIGAVTSTVTLTLLEGDESDMSDAAAVSADDIIGELTTILTTDANSVKWLGYIGKKRYVQLSIVSGDATFGAVAIKGHAVSVPTL